MLKMNKASGINVAKTLATKQDVDRLKQAGLTGAIFPKKQITAAERKIDLVQIAHALNAKPS